MCSSDLLKNQGIPCSEEIKLGMMVEIPAAAVLANEPGVEIPNRRDQNCGPAVH